MNTFFFFFWVASISHNRVFAASCLSESNAHMHTHMNKKKREWNSKVKVLEVTQYGTIIMITYI